MKEKYDSDMDSLNMFYDLRNCQVLVNCVPFGL